MQKIDSHQHFWKYSPVNHDWISEDMAYIRRDFLPDDLEPVLKRNGFTGCVAVQADQTDEETAFLLELAEQKNFIRGVVGWTDLRSENVESRLTANSQFPKLKGFRHILQGEENRSLMLTNEFKRGIASLKQFGFTYDILIYPDQLMYIGEFVTSFPEQPFVIDHIAKPNIKEGEIKEWVAGIRSIAKHEHVFCKISGMLTEADWNNWSKEDFISYIEVIFEAFGADRVMFGSDWPVCLVAGTYEDVLSVPDHYFSALSADEQAKFWGTNAAKFYNLDI